MDARARDLATAAAVTTAAAAVHAFAPAGPHAWHGLHLVSAKLYYVPILLSARSFGFRGAVAAASAVTALTLVSAAVDWAAWPMVQFEQVAEVATFWLVGLLAAMLLGRERRAREATRAAHEETLAALAASLELRERYTAGHSRRVRDYALRLADELDLREPAFLASLAQGALLHDIGKIGIPDWILLMPAPLGPDERLIMRRHPVLGAELVDKIGWLRPARELILTHHERYDGKGYPRGLQGEAIPLAARVFAVADTFDALTTERPYHAAVAWEDAACTLAAGRGSQFDPAPVDAFLRVPFEDWVRIASATGMALRGPSAGAHAGPEASATRLVGVEVQP